MNKMHQVAHILGVEIGEKFNTKFGCSDYILTENGVFEYDVFTEDTYGRPQVLENLLTGSDEIIRKPWKPADGQYYYYVFKDGRIIQTPFLPKDFLLDCYNLKLGNCFKTREGITPEIIEKYVKFLNSDEVISIE